MVVAMAMGMRLREREGDNEEERLDQITDDSQHKKRRIDCSISSPNTGTIADTGDAKSNYNISDSHSSREFKPPTMALGERNSPDIDENLHSHQLEAALCVQYSDLWHARAWCRDCSLYEHMEDIDYETGWRYFSQILEAKFLKMGEWIWYHFLFWRSWCPTISST